MTTAQTASMSWVVAAPGLDRVVQNPGGDQTVAMTSVVQQRRDLQRMDDELGDVGLPTPAAMRLTRERVRLSRERQLTQEVGAPAVSDDALKAGREARAASLPGRRWDRARALGDELRPRPAATQSFSSSVRASKGAISSRAVKSISGPSSHEEQPKSTAPSAAPA